mmetsp:Transcript_96557/g.216295  ORF Transcript_96557/g.216295 Transcript_96557/m.216295 type:complete len:234 (+) Transcript_96557:221-922(+)
MEDVVRVRGRGLARLGVQVAHDTEEPCEVEELIVLEHAVPVEVEDLGEAQALLLGHREGMGLAHAHDDREEVGGHEHAVLLLIQLLELGVAGHDKLVARQPVVDVLRQQGDHLVHGLPVLLQEFDELLHGTLVLRDLGELLVGLLVVVVGLEKGHDEDEAGQGCELVPRDDTVLADVEDLDEVLAMLLGEGVVVRLTQVEDHRDKLLWLQDAALVLVQVLEVSGAMRLELGAA